MRGLHEEEIKTVNALEPFLLLAKNARGAAAAQLVQQVTETAGVFVFNELLHMQGIKELESNDKYAHAWQLLQLFAFGTLKDYKENVSNVQSLSTQQLFKLRLLTIATLASQSKYVSYKTLQEQLDLSNVRELEDLIIDAIYAGILCCKLDPKEQQLEVEYVIGRDIRPQLLDTIISTLGEWHSNCEKAMLMLDNEIDETNSMKEKQTNLNRSVELEVENMKQTLKLQEIQQQGLELDPTSSSSSTSQLNNQKSASKFKIIKSNVKASSSRTK